MVVGVIPLVLDPSPACFWSTLVYEHQNTRKTDAKYIREEAFC